MSGRYYGPPATVKGGDALYAGAPDDADANPDDVRLNPEHPAYPILFQMSRKPHVFKDKEGSATPDEPKYPLLESLAKATAKVNEFASKPFGYDNPPGAIASDIVGIPAASRTLGKMAWGDFHPLENSKKGRETRGDLAEMIPLAAMGAKTAAKPLIKLSGKLVPAEGTLNMFAGPGAKTADKSMLDAAKMGEQFRDSPDNIWKQTGWMKGKDGEWRFEIDDSKATITPPKSRNATLGDILQHDDLYKAYPRLKNLMVEVKDDMGPNNYAAYGHARSGDVTKDRMLINQDLLKDPEKLKSAILHEVQHGIQKDEGFAAGADPSKTKTFEEYQRSAGEVEARTTQTRKDYTKEERKERYPLKDYDRSYDKLIVDKNRPPSQPISALATKPPKGAQLSKERKEYLEWEQDARKMAAPLGASAMAAVDDAVAQVDKDWGKRKEAMLLVKEKLENMSDAADTAKKIKEQEKRKKERKE